jgi:hypothetical protein
MRFERFSAPNVPETNPSRLPSAGAFIKSDLPS